MDDKIWETNLLKELEKRPAIWLPSHENHKKNRIVGALWREIASAVNINRNLNYIYLFYANAKK